jgi:hypothetical protein
MKGGRPRDAGRRPGAAVDARPFPAGGPAVMRPGGEGRAVKEPAVTGWAAKEPAMVTNSGAEKAKKKALNELHKQRGMFELRHAENNHDHMVESFAVLMVTIAPWAILWFSAWAEARWLGGPVQLPNPEENQPAASGYELQGAVIGPPVAVAVLAAPATGPQTVS